MLLANRNTLSWKGSSLLRRQFANARWSAQFAELETYSLTIYAALLSSGQGIIGGMSRL
jgi:hypothetical protein